MHADTLRIDTEVTTIVGLGGIGLGPGGGRSDARSEILCGNAHRK